jgi:hypothetical protein
MKASSVGGSLTPSISGRLSGSKNECLRCRRFLGRQERGKKKAGPEGPAEVRSDKMSKTFQRGTAETASQGGRSDAALNSAKVYIGRSLPFCNAACIM